MNDFRDSWQFILGRELYFPSNYFFADRRLRNHKIKTEHVENLDQCEYLCYLHEDCVSVNIKKDTDSTTGQRECELNNSTHTEDDRDLENDNAYLYRGAKVINTRKVFLIFEFIGLVLNYIYLGLSKGIPIKVIKIKEISEIQIF